MPVRIYTKIDGFGGTDDLESNSRDRVLIIEGESDEKKIFTAVDDSTGATVPNLGSPHPVFTGLKLKSRTPNRIRRDLWEMRLNFGGAQLEGTGAPAATGLRYQWEPGQTTETRDYDIYDKPLVDRAGVPLANGFPFTSCTQFLSIWRTEPTFDLPTSFGIRMHVNKFKMRVFQWFVDPGQMMCWEYRPDKAQRLGDTSVETKYLFEFRPGLRPFQPRWANRGYNGWNTANELGHFVRGTIERVGEPIPLTMNGNVQINYQNKIRVERLEGTTPLPTAANPNAATQFSTVETRTQQHSEPPSATSAKIFQWAYNEWRFGTGTPVETIFLSQDFYAETDFRGLIPGIM